MRGVTIGRFTFLGAIYGTPYLAPPPFFVGKDTSDTLFLTLRDNHEAQPSQTIEILAAVVPVQVDCLLLPWVSRNYGPS